MFHICNPLSLNTFSPSDIICVTYNVTEIGGKLAIKKAEINSAIMPLISAPEPIEFYRGRATVYPAIGNYDEKSALTMNNFPITFRNSHLCSA